MQRSVYHVSGGLQGIHVNHKTHSPDFPSPEGQERGSLPRWAGLPARRLVPPAAAAFGDPLEVPVGVNRVVPVFCCRNQHLRSPPALRTPELLSGAFWMGTEGALRVGLGATCACLSSSGLSLPAAGAAGSCPSLHPAPTTAVTVTSRAGRGYGRCHGQLWWRLVVPVAGCGGTMGAPHQGGRGTGRLSSGGEAAWAARQPPPLPEQELDSTATGHV